MSAPTKIFIDADGCPVKEEVYKVAARYGLEVFVVANAWLNVPLDPKISMQVVSGGFDAADDWIVKETKPYDLVITNDILLADRCVKKQVRVLDAKGEEFTEDNVGSRVAGRELMAHLRNMGEMRGGPRPMDKKARSNFLNSIDRVLQAIKRHKPS